jgi:nucleoside-diphosphate-sugar epimerase
MNVLLFGATGMVGQGVLRECLRDVRVKRVIAVVRARLGFAHPKVREVIHQDFTDFSSSAGAFEQVDACFYCLGITSAGKGEDKYRRITHDYTLAAPRALPANRSLTFIYVSGEGTDSTERGPSMWARGASQRPHGERAPGDALPRLYVSSRLYPGAVRRNLQNPSVPLAVRWSVLALSIATAANAETCDDH